MMNDDVHLYLAASCGLTPFFQGISACMEPHVPSASLHCTH